MVHSSLPISMIFSFAITSLNSFIMIAHTCHPLAQRPPNIEILLRLIDRYDRAEGQIVLAYFLISSAVIVISSDLKVANLSRSSKYIGVDKCHRFTLVKLTLLLKQYMKIAFLQRSSEYWSYFYLANLSSNDSSGPNLILIYHFLSRQIIEDPWVGFVR